MLVGIAAALYQSAGAPIFVRDETLTIDQRVVWKLRFRTTGAGHLKLPSLGRFLRRWRLDELPAIFNVLRGELKLRDLPDWHR